MQLEPFVFENAMSPSEMARERILEVRGNPLFICDWLRVVFMHYEVDKDLLRRAVPFPLDLRDGSAYISLVAFTMVGMRPRLGGSLFARIFRPIATHEFLNCRTYVQQGAEPGIYFLAEWLPNRLSVLLGPRIFGLPYRHGQMNYSRISAEHPVSQTITEPKSKRSLEYSAILPEDHSSSRCPRGSLVEFLMERYTAFTAVGRRRGKFRVWHEPWTQSKLKLQVTEDSLLRATWPWFESARLAGANYSRGRHGVWMGRPQFVR